MWQVSEVTNSLRQSAIMTKTPRRRLYRMQPGTQKWQAHCSRSKMVIWSNSRIRNYSYLPGNYSYLSYALLLWQDQIYLERLKAMFSLSFIWKHINRRFALHSYSLCRLSSHSYGQYNYLQFSQEMLTDNFLRNSTCSSVLNGLTRHVCSVSIHLSHGKLHCIV